MMGRFAASRAAGSRRRVPLALIAVIAVLASGCSGFPAAQDEKGSLLVRVRYLQDLELPPDAVLVVQLRELSAPGDPPKLVAERQVDSPEGMPVSVLLPYERGRVDPSRRYEVAAWIHRGEWVPLMRGTGKPVLTGRFPDPVEVLLRPSR